MSADLSTYQDGDHAACQRCGKSIRIKTVAPGKIVFMTGEIRKEIAYRCQACGYVTCESCAADPENAEIPLCPSCGKSGGPFFFPPPAAPAPENKAKPETRPVENTPAGAKPILPSISAAAWLRPFKHSGICPPGAYPLMFGLGALAGVITGVAAYYGGTVTSFLGGLGLGLIVWMGGCLGKCLGTALAIFYGILLVAFLGIGTPFALGSVLGYLIWLAAKKSKCRSPNWAGTAGFLSGALAYTVFVLMTVHLAGGLRETAQLTRLIELSSNSIWMIVIVALDGFILICCAWGVALTMVNDAPFCETCQSWYLEPQKMTFSINAAGPLLQCLEHGDWQELQNYSQNQKKYPQLELALQKCPCEKSEFRLRVTRFWQDAKPEKDGSKPEIKNELWFTTMLSSVSGQLFESRLLKGPEKPAHNPPTPISPFHDPQPGAGLLPIVTALDANKICPNCGNEIKAEARLCRFCKTSLETVVRGYCTTCHQLMNADENRRCAQCHAELADLHVESKLVKAGADPRFTYATDSPAFIRTMLLAKETKNETLFKTLIQHPIRCENCKALVNYQEAFHVGAEQIDGNSYRVTRAPWLSCPHCGNCWYQF